jgi:MGT family glycosyltransferase
LKPLSHLLEQLEVACVELLATSRAFDFEAECLPERVKYVGPLISDPTWVESWKSPWPETDKRPLVTVGFSTTFQNHAGILQKVIDALAPLPVRVLVTRGGSIEEGELVPAANCVVAESVPHTVVMKESAVVVTHGGHGTVMRGLVAKKPLLVIPHGRDQNDNAVRITERGAGLRLEAGASVEEIRAACARLLEDGAFARNAKALGEKVVAEAEGCSVVEALEEAAEGAVCVGA